MSGLFGILKSFWDGVVGVLNNIATWVSVLFGALKSLFSGGSILDIIDAIVMAPVATVCKNLGTAGMNACTSLITILGQNTVQSLKLDIGNGDSMFEKLFAIDWVIELMQIIGFVLLACFMFLALAEVIFSPRPSESPFRIIGFSFMAGIGIHFAPVLMQAAMDFFGKAYAKVLDAVELQDCNLTNLSTGITDCFAAMAEKTAGGSGSSKWQGFITDSYYLSIAIASILGMILMIFVTVQFVKFIMEVFQRYCLLGVMVMTAPAAFSLIGTKNMRPAFTRWLRMVGCQFLLMFFNVFILHVFFSCNESIQSVIDSAKEAGAIMTIILVCMCLQGILYIGCQIDTYLRSLGLSVAETGAGTIATAVSGAMQFGYLNRAVGLANGFFSGNESGNSAGGDRPVSPVGGGAAPAVSKMLGKSNNEVAPKAHERIKRRSDGKVSAVSLNDAVMNMGSKENLSGYDIGQAVLDNLRGVSKREKQDLNLSSCTIENGRIHFDGMHSSSTPQSNQMSGLTLVPASLVTSENNPKGYGRKVSIGKEPYVAFAEGPGAHRFNIAGFNTEEALRQKYYGSVVPVVTKSPSVSTDKAKKTGCYEGIVRSENNGKMYAQWLPCAAYQMPDSKYWPVKESINGIDYWRATRTLSPEDVSRIKSDANDLRISSGNDLANFLPNIGQDAVERNSAKAEFVASNESGFVFRVKEQDFANDNDGLPNELTKQVENEKGPYRYFAAKPAANYVPQDDSPESFFTMDQNGIGYTVQEMRQHAASGIYGNGQGTTDYENRAQLIAESDMMFARQDEPILSKETAIEDVDISLLSHIRGKSENSVFMGAFAKRNKQAPEREEE